MAKTYRGIYHNLYETEYATSNGEVAFFFSSVSYRDKFMETHKEHRKTFRKRISRAMKVHEMNTSLLADITLYEEIEKRGFRITIGGNETSWQESREYGLAKMTEKSMHDWYVMQSQK